MAKGFVYLVAVVDWASRKVLVANIAITLEACHAVDVLQEAFNRHGTPEIVNTDQGSQFTAEEFVKAVKDRGCRLSMDGRGAWQNNVFVEPLWKTVKYERVSLYTYDSVNEARRSIMEYLDWYNRCRPHSMSVTTGKGGGLKNLEPLKAAYATDSLTTIRWSSCWQDRW